MLGTVGHLLTLIAFVACGLSGLAFFLAAQHKQGTSDWKRIGRVAWGTMMGALLVASGILFYLLFTHQFQYAYVYQYTSLAQQTRYVFSAFWAGQEGSFLLWILMTGWVGVALIKWAKDYEATTMTVVAFCQLFLVSMIVGLKIGAVPIGSSPFMLLAEKFPEAPMLQQPGFVPPDGNGLNDLLQNPWMVIHPPTLFVGFSAMIVPFAFAIAALWKKRYTEWVRPALPWTLFATMILGVGIAMGGYWAYVTLSFGGYWAWDPVENSSLVPWIIGVAALHAMIIQKKSHTGHKAALLLSILAYMLVIYSTFLTRSGILGDISVHSFVDLGLTNQLLVWILAMGTVGFGFFAVRYRELPRPRREPHMLSREFMIFSGAMLLCATAAVILLGTSAPIFGRIFRDNPSGVPIDFYNKWTLPISVLFVFLAGLGQLFWWNKMSVEQMNRVLLKPIAFSVAATVGVLIFTPFVERTTQMAAPAATQPLAQEAGLLGGLGTFWATNGTGILMLLLVFMAFFALFGNGMVLWRVGRGNLKMAGGAISHVGFALLILGVVASSGFSNPLGRTTDSTGEVRDNFILARGETRNVNGYEVTYAGKERNEQGRSVYTLDFVDPAGRAFTLQPVVYQGNDEQWIQHPDLKIYAEKDIYAAVSPAAMFEQTSEGPAGGELKMVQGDSTTLGSDEFTVTFAGLDTDVNPEMLPDSTEIAVAAVLNVTNQRTGEARQLRPIYLIMQDRQQQFIQNRVRDWGLTVTFTGMDVDTGNINLVVEGVEVSPEDWLVVQAYEKPFIGMLWIGIILLSIGFCFSIFRRAQEYQRVYRLREEAAL